MKNKIIADKNLPIRFPIFGILILIMLTQLGGISPVLLTWAWVIVILQGLVSIIQLIKYEKVDLFKED